MKYTQYFIQKQRINDKSFYCLTEDAPQELKDLVKAVHFDIFEGALPNDWIYHAIYDAVSDIEENDSYEIEDLIKTDEINFALFYWLQECPYAHCFCDEELENGLASHNLIDIIQAGQYRAKEQIYSLVAEFLEYQARHAEV